MNLSQTLSSTRLHFVTDYDQAKEYDLILTIADDEAQWQQIPHGKTIYQRKTRQGISKKKGYLTQLPTAYGTKIIVKNSTSDCDLYMWFKDLSSLLKESNVAEAKKIAFITDNATDTCVESCMRALLSHTENMPNLKREKKLCEASIDIIGDYVEGDLMEVIAKHKGNALARYLTILPTNYLTPKSYIETVKNLAKAEDWDFKLYDKATLLEMSAGAFSAVAQASDVAGIVKLTYTPKEYKNTLALVGKGICFDTGGVSLKPSQYMYGMNDDMMGSAVAVGSLLSLSMMQVPVQIQCYLAISNNNIGSNAFLLNEVITALNGKTIEIIDTDAEGRLVLADTLALASQEKPDVMIDYATLTGTAVRAIGTEYSAIFSNQYDWQNNLVKYGIKSAEKVWPFPMDKHYLEELKSEIADLKQCSESAAPDHILAAKFLQQFVGKDIRWLHMDLASCKHKGGLAPTPTEVSGVGVWYTCELVEQFLA